MEERNPDLSRCEHCGVLEGRMHSPGCPALPQPNQGREPWGEGELRPLRKGDGFTIAGHDYLVTEVLPRGRFRLKLVARP